MNIAQTQTFRLKESTDSHLRFRALSTHVSYSSYEKTFAHTLLKKHDLKYAHPSIYGSHSSHGSFPSRTRRKWSLSKFEMKTLMKILPFTDVI